MTDSMIQKNAIAFIALLLSVLLCFSATVQADDYSSDQRDFDADAYYDLLETCATMKFNLFDMPSEQVPAEAKVERIGRKTYQCPIHSPGVMR